ncbi:MAG: twin transmembrane helix small protein [Gammaproteobacteria bacterium]|nr:twin transmembrane helix small protein [Gammaproteobacteria bacterium]
MDIFRTLVAVVMIGIVLSLGSALFHLMTDKGDSKKMVRALTVRVALSVGLFLLLMAAWAAGLIQPLGSVPR